MANAYGLTEHDIDEITAAIGRFDEIGEVVLFGSRAKGNYKPGSDVDLAVKGDRVTRRTIAQLANCLNEEKPLPYFRVGVAIYAKASVSP